jgi:radical SAM protein with 4Fe4S-binding SPASM domain
MTLLDDIIKGASKKKRLKHVTLDGVRLHLKTDEKKLWINGYYTLFLNDTAYFIVESLIDSCYEVPKRKVVETTVNKIHRKYDITKEKAEEDLHQVIGIINSFARNEIPAHLVGMKVIEGNVNAPNRMDLSLSYTCNNHCPHCYLPKNIDENGRLTTDEWKQVIDKLWYIGIPQVVFTGGECTLQSNLVELVEYAKEFTSGIISNGTRISLNLARKLKKADLDWIQITLETNNEKTHDEMQGRKGAFKETIQGIKNCVKAGLIVSVNATLTKKNYKDIKGLINLAKKLKVSAVSTNAIIRAGRGAKVKNEQGIDEKLLNKIVKEAKEYAHKKGILFNWFLPTCYENMNPVKLGFGERGCSACSINMMIEPNGDVIPCQSWTSKKIGNILEDTWDSIWNNPESVKIREGKYNKHKCSVENCGGGCPLENINGCYR